MSAPAPSLRSRSGLWIIVASATGLVGFVWMMLHRDVAPVGHTASPRPALQDTPDRGGVTPQPSRVTPPARQRPVPSIAVPLPLTNPEEAAPVEPSPLDRLPADPFEPQEGQEAAIRTLATVGEIRLGVVRGAHVTDEVALTKALTQIAEELEASGKEALRQGALDRQGLLDAHREELGRWVEGEVELRGADWMIGLQVGTPPPLEEQEWRPRPY